ncbi:putative cytochrome P450 monooxygenase [Linderina pennispora]|uniref:Putative cytochrome P450 monooxygenase n=1 Tax=Linderina pennispora TaxID=61395 RepID=A0A1Y1WI77_9FUNG|nr:putative cytochrome P450 monooxygenase [Linderina pennispora]ORX73028.1 putative cytochrome P450 monooxygenase [Linderina pennispora]
MLLIDFIQSVDVDSLVARVGEIGFAKISTGADGSPGQLQAPARTSGTINRYALSEYETYGDVFVLEPNAVAICNPADVRTVLGSHAFAKFYDFYHTVDLLGVKNTFSATDPAFVNMRKRQLGPFFTQSFLNQMEPMILERGIRSLESKWDEMLSRSADGKVEIGYSNDFMLATFDIIGALATTTQEIIDWVNAAVMYNGTMATVPVTNYFPFSLLLNPWKQKFHQLAQFCRRAADRRRELLRQGREKPVDLLQAYIDAEDPESKVRMDETQITAESIVATVAGTDTSATTLTWTVHLLMNHPEIYKQVVEEVRSNFAAEHLITHADVKSKLPLVEAIIYESMRLCPVQGGYLPRVAPPSGVTLQGHFIPGGTQIYINYGAVSHHREIWVEPHKFDPTRFLNSEAARRNFFAFSPGVRICPGRHLAFLEMQTILANMLKDYDWSLPEDYTHIGPEVIGEHGYPKIIEASHLLVTAPKNPERDCRLVISRHA